jgi:probable rRNA maturation factor
VTRSSPGDVEAGPTVDVLIESDLWQSVPDAESVVRRAIALAASQEATACCSKAGLSVLLCDDQTIADLNARWRGLAKPTNVLSFPAPATRQAIPDRRIPLGDIAIAYETVAREAGEQGKPVTNHLSHLAVHGFLHLLGYDHQRDGEAEQMERLERDILARIGIADPYASREI